MTKKDLINHVAAKTGLSFRQATKAVNAVFDGILECIKSGGQIKISNFGKFQLVERKPRRGRNPQTGEVVEIPARRTIQFKASRKLKTIKA